MMGQLNRHLKPINAKLKRKLWPEKFESENKMNERIRELASKVWYHGNLEEQNENIQMFAELIVREMLVTCEEHPAWTGRMIGNQIKEHFGVEK